MELDGYDFARLLELDAPIDPSEWLLEPLEDGTYRIVRVVDGVTSRVWGKSDPFHSALVRFLMANGAAVRSNR